MTCGLVRASSCLRLLHQTHVLLDGVESDLEELWTGDRWQVYWYGTNREGVFSDRIVVEVVATISTVMVSVGPITRAAPSGQFADSWR